MPPPPKPKLIRRPIRVGPQIDAGQIASGKGDFAKELGEAIKRKAEADEERSQPKPKVKWAISELEGPPVLARKAPMDHAKLFARDMLTFHEIGGAIGAQGREPVLGTYYYRDH